MTSSNASRIEGLDGLRGLAIVLVLLFHQQVAPFGWIGVQLFFVLSGYLITGILDRDREKSLWRYLFDFYGRRALRIFPVYYALLGALAIACLATTRTAPTSAIGMELRRLSLDLPYAATYLYNFHHSIAPFEDAKSIGHLWSLCVEEQFYLIWPLLLYTLSPKRTARALLFIVLLGPVFRWGVHRWFEGAGVSEPSLAVYFITSSHFDAFAVGGLVRLHEPRSPRAFIAVTWGAVAVGSLIAFASASPPSLPSLGYPSGMEPAGGFLWGYSVLNLAAAATVVAVARGHLSPRLWRSPVLSYLGRISYGMYVFHMPLQLMVHAAWRDGPLLLKLLVHAAITISCADLSFRFFETPILKLKSKWFETKNHELPSAS